MPALFAYLVALSLLLGGGYASLQWLSAPDTSVNPPLSVSKRPPANKGVVEKSGPHVTGATPAKTRPYDRAEPEITGSAPVSEALINVAPVAAPDQTDIAASNQTGVSEDDKKLQTKNREDAPAGGCMPVGVTAQGELVFPMQCKGVLERHRGPVDSQPVIPNDATQSPAQNDRQTAEPARSVGGNAGLNRNESQSSGSDAKAADISPSRDDQAAKEDSKPEVVIEKKDKGRNMQFSH